MELINKVKINTFFCVLLIVGFITISAFPAFLSLNSQFITIPFRAVVLGLALLIMGNNFYSKQINTFGKTEWFFVLFWIFYLIKAIVSFQTYSFSPVVASKEIETYLRIVGISFLPALAVLTIPIQEINYKKVFQFVYYILFTILLLNVLYGIDHDTQGRSSGFMSMYSISFGHLGVSLTLLSIYTIFYESVDQKYKLIIPILGVILGTYIMYASGTRSPLIAYAFCICFLFYVKNKLKYLYAFLFLLIVGAIALIYFKPQYDGGQASSFLSRVTKMLVSGDSSGRGALYQQGINIFTEHPILGGRILYFDGMYPHNIFLEVVMALGIVGLIIYFLFFKNCINFILKIKAFSMHHVEVIWVAVLWLQYFILSLFSYNIHSSPEIWYFTAMILVFNKKAITEIA